MISKQFFKTVFSSQVFDPQPLSCSYHGLPKIHVLDEYFLISRVLSQKQNLNNGEIDCVYG